jgi:hypothetical protein
MSYIHHGEIRTHDLLFRWRPVQFKRFLDADKRYIMHFSASKIFCNVTEYHFIYRFCAFVNGLNGLISVNLKIICIEFQGDSQNSPHVPLYFD